MLKKYGYVRVGSAVLELKVGNVEYNAEEIIKLIKKADKEGANIVNFPALALTGSTCNDLFYQEVLLKSCLDYLKVILDKTKKLDIISIIGMPLSLDNQLFNTAVVVQRGEILGIVPNTYSANNYWSYYNEQYQIINLFGKEIPFGTNLLFQDKEDKKMCFGIEISEDLESIKTPSTEHSLNGASIIFNLASSYDMIGSYEFHHNVVKVQSVKSKIAYVYTSAGSNESTTDGVCAGDNFIYENGKLLNEGERFKFTSSMIITDIDTHRLMNQRYRGLKFKSNQNYLKILVDILDKNDTLKRNYAMYPFIPNNEEELYKRCEEIFNIQTNSLIKRLKHIDATKTVIGISGGLDSTLAFLVIVEAYKKLGFDNKNIIAITMPGFGTTSRTYKNAINLVKEFGATLKEISIKDACLQHFKDINQDLKKLDITYENAQARERTQILMDVANQEGALVIGTGDLSELALGWCTYNGDHMSMYGVNGSIPKTLVRILVKWIADHHSTNKETIYDILNTPISPELLPPDKNGNMVQKTESSVGPYILHDFYLYHFMRYGASPSKIYIIAKETFKNLYSEDDIKKWLIFFFKRFFSQQFKRSCMPDGAKVGTIGLSPRGELKMASDIDANVWLKDLENI